MQSDCRNLVSFHRQNSFFGFSQKTVSFALWKREVVFILYDVALNDVVDCTAVSRTEPGDKAANRRFLGLPCIMDNLVLTLLGDEGVGDLNATNLKILLSVIDSSII